MTTQTAEAPTTAATLTDALNFIANSATAEDFDALNNAMKARRAILTTLRAATLRKDTPVTLSGLTPKYLNGLTGKVGSPNTTGTRFDVMLDATSTASLRRRHTRFYIAPDTTEHLLSGVPVACLIPTK